MFSLVKFEQAKKMHSISLLLLHSRSTKHILFCLEIMYNVNMRYVFQTKDARNKIYASACKTGP